MSREMAALLELTSQLSQANTLEDMLQRLVDAAAAALGVERASVRMLDASGHKLLVGARAGESLHQGAISFSKGEGLLGWVLENARPLRLADAEADVRFVERPSRRGELGSFLAVPLLDGQTAVGVLSAVHERLDFFSADQEAELGVMAALCAPHLCIARLRRLSEVDPLTGALNRRGMDGAFPELGADGTGGGALSVVLLDIDHFKAVNDTFGHDVGDLALLALTNVLAGISRKGDAVVRLGGEEFLLLLPGANANAATRVAERARAAVASHRIVCAKGTVQFTVSAGVAERRPGESREALLERADHAMYEAKGLGRDRVRVSELPAPPSARLRAGVTRLATRHRAPAPRDLDELTNRAASLRGVSIEALASSFPAFAGIARDERSQLHTKGKVGELIERVLGAAPGAGAVLDFPELGVELKTIPVDARGQPTESTFVCAFSVADADRAEWVTSWTREKLAHVLWVPIATDSSGERRIAHPFFWRPTDGQEAVLRADFDDVMGRIGIGDIESVTAHLGRWLQVRPKAANGAARTLAFGSEGERIDTMPRGFYLRARFTGALLRDPRAEPPLGPAHQPRSLKSRGRRPLAAWSLPS